MSDKPKHPAAIARAVAEKIVAALRPVCSRIEIAGSLRRKKDQVGDIEVVYIPKFTEVPDPASLFPGEHKMRVNAADLIIQQLIVRGSLEKRLNALDRESWGEWNKYATAVKTGIPVDLFATTEDAWFNYLVCRTGPAESNTRIADQAKKKGWMWHPTRSGFENISANSPDKWHVVTCERAVFDFVGLPYFEPERRS